MSKAKKQYNRVDVYETVTNQIIEHMEKCANEGGNGSLWSASADVMAHPINALTGNQYNGINTLLLWFAQQEHTSNAWLTYKQAQELGGNVKKGEKGQIIVIYKPWEREQENAKGETETVVIPMIKHATVFNVDQCENLDYSRIDIVEHIACETPQLLANQVAAQAGAKVSSGGNTPCFIPSMDLIKMPYLETFHNDQGQAETIYSAILLHELTHWTGHESRLNRLKNDKFGSKGYAFEELIAELGAAMLCATLGIQTHPAHHAKYLNSWIKVLKEDKKAIFTAAAAAQKSTDLILDKHSAALAA